MDKNENEISRYKMFRNFMVNELGITKADIEEWTKQAVLQVAENYAQHRMSEKTFEEGVDRAIRKLVERFVTSNEMKQLVGKALAENIQITVKEQKPTSIDLENFVGKRVMVSSEVGTYTGQLVPESFAYKIIGYNMSWYRNGESVGRELKHNITSIKEVK